MIVFCIKLILNFNILLYWFVLSNPFDVVIVVLGINTLIGIKKGIQIMTGATCGAGTSYPV
jgi:hypothetical protein